MPEFPRGPGAPPGTVVGMILVTGATGTIGSEVVRLLAARGEKTRALTRDPARARVPSGVEVVRGDFRAPGTVEAAMAGAEAQVEHPDVLEAVHARDHQDLDGVGAREYP